MNKKNSQVSNSFNGVLISVIFALASFIALYYNDTFQIKEIAYKSDFFLNSSNYVKINVTFSSIEYDKDLNQLIAKSKDTLIQNISILLFYPKNSHDANFYYEKSSDFNYVIYYNKYRNIAFYDPEFDGVISELLKNGYSVCCIFLFIFSIVSVGLYAIKYWVIEKPFVKEYIDKHETINPLKEGFIVSCLVLSLVLAIWSLGSCISYVYKSSNDWYVNYEKYEKKYLLIDSFNVHSSYSESFGINNETIFFGYNGECYSKELNNYQTRINVVENKTLILNSDGDFIPYKYYIWFRKDKNIAYLPNNNQPLNSFWQELFLRLSKNWAIYFSILLTPFFYYLKIKINNEKN